MRPDYHKDSETQSTNNAASTCRHSRESGNPGGHRTIWIPAFAGMTAAGKARLALVLCVSVPLWFSYPNTPDVPSYSSLAPVAASSA